MNKNNDIVTFLTNLRDNTMSDKYDLAYKSIDEFPVDVAAPASGDSLLRYNSSAGTFKRVDATDLTLLLGVSASAAEIDLVANTETRRVTLAANTVLSGALHESRTIVTNSSTGYTFTLPAAYNGGYFRFALDTTISSGSMVIKTANATDIIQGSLIAVDSDDNSFKGWATAADTDTITLDGTNTGGKAGDIIELYYSANNVWCVRGSIRQSGGSEATPFSATVS